jgi:hypothetical protein
MDNMNKTYYKIGYESGFEEGLIAAKYCSNCEHIQQCQDDDKKTDYCHYAKSKNKI